MPGVIHVILITRQHFGQIPTYCKKCRKPITFKLMADGFSYTKKCDCGCNIFSYYEPDVSHRTAFYTRVFVPAAKFDPAYKHKDSLEKQGFKKLEQPNGKKVYSK